MIAPERMSLSAVVAIDLRTVNASSLMRTVKSYEKYTVEAGMKGSDEDAMNALMLHPLCGDIAQAKACYEEMKEAHKKYLPQFFKNEQ